MKRLLLLLGISLCCWQLANAQINCDANISIVGSACVDEEIAIKVTGLDSSLVQHYRMTVSGRTDTLQASTDSTFIISAFSSSGQKTVTLFDTAWTCVQDFIFSVSALPSVGFTHDSDSLNPKCAGDSVTFTNTSASGASITYSWDFGAGNVSTDTNPSHSFDALGEGTADFSVSLAVMDSSTGCSDTISNTIKITERPIVDLRNSVNNREITEFNNCRNAKATSPSYSIDFTDSSSSNVDTFNISWGDGNSYSATTAPSSYNYSGLGIYDIEYEVINDSGCKSVRNYSVLNISNPAVGGSKPPSTDGCGPLVIDFTIEGYSSNFSSTTYTIDPGDGTNVVVLSHTDLDADSTTTYTHTYSTTSCGNNANNEFEFKITANNDCDQSEAVLKPIKIYTAPEADFDVDKEFLCVDDVLRINNNTIEGRDSDCFADTRYEWDLGDSTTLVVFNKNPITHSYDSAGEYTINLDAINSCDTTDKQRLVTVCDSIPQSGFRLLYGTDTLGFSTIGCSAFDTIFLADTICPGPGLQIGLQDLSTSVDCPNSFDWAVLGGTGAKFLNDELESNNQNDTLTIRRGGTYQIKLEVSNVCGETSSCIVLVVNQPPVAPEIAGAAPKICVDDSVDLSIGAQEVVDTYQWTIAGINGTPNPTTSVDLTVPDLAPVQLPVGEYQFRARVTNECGSFADTVTVSVGAFPDTALNVVGPNPLCEGQSLDVSVLNSALNTYQWLRNDAELLNDTLAALTINEAGDYRVAILTDHGCRDTSAILPVVLDSLPDVQPIVGLDAQICSNDSLRLSVNDQNGISHLWQVRGLGATANPALQLDSTQTQFGAFVLDSGLFEVRVLFYNRCDTLTTADTVRVLTYPDASLNVNGVAGLCAVPFITVEALPLDTALFDYAWRKDGAMLSGRTNDTLRVANPGDYEVIISNEDFCLDTSAVLKIESFEQAEPAFSIPAAVCAFDSVPLIAANNNDSARVETVTWSVVGAVNLPLIADASADTTYMVFGENQSDSAQTFTVRLRMVTDSGCVSITERTIALSPRPLVDFTFNNQYCSDTNAIAFAQNTLRANAYDWSVLNGGAGIQLAEPDSLDPEIVLLNGTLDTLFFDVRLIASNGDGCSDSLTQGIILQPSPQMQISGDRSPICTGGSIALDSAGSLAGDGLIITDYRWFISGVEQTPTNDDLNASLINLGVTDSLFVITLIGQNDAGCFGGRTETVRVYPDAEAEINATTTSACAPFLIDGNVISRVHYPDANGAYQWQLYVSDTLNATTTGATPPSFNATVPGLRIKYVLTANSPNGCQQSQDSVTLRSFPEVTADFTASAQALCEGQAFSFTDNSSTNTARRIWDFGDGDTTHTENPDHIFANAQFDQDTVYLVRLIAVSDSGCTDTASTAVTVYPLPSSDFAVPTICAGDSLPTTNNSIGKNGLIYTWATDKPLLMQIGDVAAETPNLTFADSQGADTTLTLSLEVVSGDGCVEDSSITLTIFGRPTAGIRLDSLQCLASGAVFENLTTTASSSPVNNHLWDFGDGNTTTLPDTTRATHSYGSTIVYTATLVATSDEGCQDTARGTVRMVDVPAPHIDQVLDPLSLCTPVQGTFEGDSSTVYQVGETYAWDFDNGQASAKINPDPVIFGQDGVNDTIYTIELEITNFCGTGRDTSDILVHPNARAVVNTTTTAACAPFTIDGSVVSLVDYPNANTPDYLWEVFLGDSLVASATGMNPPTYQVLVPDLTVKYRLTAFSRFGCEDRQDSLTIRSFPASIARFTAATDALCEQASLAFTSQSTNAALHNWTFGDGAISTDVNPVHIFDNQSFTQDTAFTVSLQTNSSDGCIGTADTLITIHPKPFSSFALASICAGDTLVPTNGSIGKGQLSYDWSASNAGLLAIAPADSITPILAFTDWQNGDRTVNLTLEVTSEDGCLEDTTLTPTIFSRPSARIGVDSLQCLAAGAVFDNLSTNASSAPDSLYIWNYGDGQVENFTSRAQADRTYASTDRFVVTLTAINEAKCRDITQDSLRMIDVPIAVITDSLSPDDRCAPVLGRFDSDSSRVFAAFEDYQWDFGDGQSSTQANPANIFFQQSEFGDTTYITELTITNECGSSTDTSQVFVRPSPIAGFSFPFTFGCDDVPIDINNDSRGLPDYFIMDFGDGTRDTIFDEEPFTHIFQNNTASDVTYTVQMVAVNECGRDTAVRNVTIKPFNDNAQIRLNAPDSIFCVGEEVEASVAGLGGSVGRITSWEYEGVSFFNTDTISFVTDSAGVFPIFLDVEIVPCGNSILDTLNIRVEDSPTISFSVENDDLCYGDTLKITNVSSSLAATTVWTFGEGSSYTGVNPPPFVYDTAGTFPLTMSLVGASGCETSVSQSIRVRDSISAAFAVNNSPLCSREAISVTNNSLNGVSYLWEVDTFGTETSFAPVLDPFADPGVYRIRLTVFDEPSQEGCSISTFQNVTAFAKPRAAFDIPDTVCLNESLIPVNNSTVVANYRWQFGNGDSSALRDPVYDYPATGSYQVSLDLSTAVGCQDSTAQNTVVINEPEVIFSFSSDQVCSGENVAITNNSNAASYLWVVTNSQGDTVLPNSTAFAPVLRLTEPDIYTVTLNAYSRFGLEGCQEVASRSFTVNRLPEADFAFAKSTVCTGSPVTLQDSSVFADSYQWNVGDGQTSTDAEPTFNFASEAVFEVKMLVRTNAGCEDSIARDLEVLQTPTANFTVLTDTICTGSSIDMDNGSQDGDRYEWDLANTAGNSIRNTMVFEPVFNVDTAGSYRLELIAVNENDRHSCFDSLFQTVTINQTPVADFTLNQTEYCTGEAVNLTNNSQFQDFDRWTASDGQTSNADTPGFVFNAPGFYDLKLVASTTAGCFDSLTKRVEYLQTPTANFTVLTDTICTGSSIDIANGSQDADRYGWDLANTAGNSIRNTTVFEPIFNVDTAGSYRLELIAVNENDRHSCFDSLFATVTINQTPVADFTLNQTEYCTGEAVDLSNESRFQDFDRWTASDGQTSNADTPGFVFNTPGFYDLKLVTSTTAGCFDSLTKRVEYLQTPTANFTVLTDTICTGSSIDIDNGSQDGDRYEWDLANTAGSSIRSTTVFEPVFNVDTAGSYRLELIAVNENDRHSCFDSLFATVTINQTPGADFTLGQLEYCTGNEVAITNTSQFQDFNRWTATGGQSSTANVPDFTYDLSGFFQIQLHVSTAAGCQDSIRRQVEYLDSPEASFAVASSPICVGSDITFTNSSVNTTQQLWELFNPDGNLIRSSTALTPIFNVDTAGNYELLLTVTNENGSYACDDSLRRQITVNQIPIPAFVLDQPVYCSGEEVMLENTTQFGNRFVWGSGDGQSRVGNVPGFRYANGGFYVIRLVATNAEGCMDSTFRQVEILQTPVAEFEVVAPQCTGENLEINNLSTFATDYRWVVLNEAGDTLQQTTDLVPFVNEDTPGIYGLHLEAINQNARYRCSDVRTSEVNIYQDPIAAFTLERSTICTADSMRLTNESQFGDRYVWDLGDGTLTNRFEPTHTYPDDGEYRIGLRVVTDFGCEDTISQLIESVELFADFEIATDPLCRGLEVTLTNLSRVTPGKEVAYQWLRDGTEISTTDDAFSLRLDKEDDNVFYDFKLIGRYLECVDSISRELEVVPFLGCSFEVPTAFYQRQEPVAEDDTWLIRFNDYDTAEVLQVDLKIYNAQSGQLVYVMDYQRDGAGQPMQYIEESDEGKDFSRHWSELVYWDGRDRNEVLVPVGRYYYILTVECCDNDTRTEKKGFIQAY